MGSWSAFGRRAGSWGMKESGIQARKRATANHATSAITAAFRTAPSLPSTRSSAPAAPLLVHVTADEVKRGEVKLLHVGGLRGRDDDADVPSRRLGAALLAGEEDRRKPPGLRRGERFQDVGARTRGREPHGHVARLRERLDLAGEHDRA